MPEQAWDKRLTDLLGHTLYGQGGFDWDLDYVGNRPENPGGYKTSEPFMGRPVSSALNQLSPFAGMAANYLGLDRRLTAALMPNAMSSNGSLFQPTNQTNSLLNQQLNRQYNAAGSYNDTMQNTLKTSMLTGMYRAQGYEEKASQEAAKAAMSQPLGMMNMAATGLLMAQDFRGMDRELKKGMASSGVMTRLDWGSMLSGAPSSLSAAQRQLLLGGEAGDKASMDAQNKAQGIALQANQKLMADFAKSPSQFGGFNAGQTGAIAAEMARTGKIDYSKLKAGGDISADVKKMTQALDPLRELFGDDIPGLMDKLDKMLGTNAMATFSPEQIQAKALQLKHTAAVTGTSVEVMGNMIGASQAYFERAGLDASGGFQVAMDATGLLAGKKDTKRLNEDKYRANTVKLLSAQQERSETKYAAGAYVLWAGKNADKLKGMDDAQKMAQFQVELGPGANSAEAISRRLNISVQDMAAAARTVEAEDARKNTNLGKFMLGGRQEKYAGRRDSYLSRMMAAQGGTAVSIQGRSLDEIKEDYKKQNKGKDLILDQAVLNSFARRTLGQGFNSSMAEQLAKDVKGSKFREAEVLQRSNLEKSMTAAGMGKGFGVTGLMEFFSNADATGKATVENLVGSVMGMGLSAGADKKAVEKVLKGLGADNMRQAEANRKSKLGEKGNAEFTKMANAVLAGTTEGGKALGTDDATVKLRREIMETLTNANAKPEDVKALMARADEAGITKSGETRKNIKDIAGDEKSLSDKERTKRDELLSEFEKLQSDPKTTGKELDSFRKGVGLEMTAAKIGLDDENLKTIKKDMAEAEKAGKSFDINASVNKIEGLSDKQRASLVEGYEKGSEKMGISTKPDMMQNILAVLNSLLSVISNWKMPTTGG